MKDHLDEPEPLQPQQPPQQQQYQEPTVRKKRVTPPQFLDIIGRSLNPGQQINRLGWEELQILAHGAGINIPTVVKKVARVPGTKGRNMKFDLTKLTNVQSSGGDDGIDYGNREYCG